MWNKIKRQNRLCVQYRNALEDLRPGLEPATGLAELRAHLPEEVIAHTAECASCVEAAETFWASRNILAKSFQFTGQFPRPARDKESVVETAPWFAAKTMAKITERETEGRQALLEWRGTVSRLASRLAAISALVLLVGSTWLYDLGGPDVRQSNTQLVEATPQATPQYLFDSTSLTANADDALATSVER